MMEQQTLNYSVNSFIYQEFTKQPPLRNQMIKYSVWRALLFSELEGTASNRRDANKLTKPYEQQFKDIAYSNERKAFYSYVFIPTDWFKSYSELSEKVRKDYRYDNISHFVCRMLYCQQQQSLQSFVQIQKRILQERLRRILGENKVSDRKLIMRLMKNILATLKEKRADQYDILAGEWDLYREQIIFNIFKDKKDETSQLYAKINFLEAEVAIRKRRAFVKRGAVYIGVESMIDIIISNYDTFLRKKLYETKPKVQQLICDDTENQFSAFLISTLKQINQQKVQDTKFDGKYNLTLKNIEGLSHKFFPPCMLNLNQHLKQQRHLMHDGRRQLWTFFKSCGMDVQDNKQYFRRHMEGSVSASQMKTHIYNIQHAYGLQGNKKQQGAWKCRTIITGPPPKKGQHHGCPFYHWRPEELADFIRKNYKVSQQNLKQILAQKEQKHFQVSCGRLFEYADVNKGDIPAQITAKLGIAPYLFFEAGMQLRERRVKQADSGVMRPEPRPDQAKASIQF